MVGGLLRAEQEFAYQKLLTYWQIGRIIQCDILIDRSEPEHGSALYRRLSEDLGIGEATLSQAVRVFRVFPDKPKKDGLNWSHYVMLTRVKAPQKRLSLKKRILKEHLTDPDLRRIIKNLTQPEDFIINNGRLEVQRGKLYHYRTRQVKNLHPDGGAIEIDCGFDISINKPKNVTAALSQGKIVRSIKRKDGYTVTQPKPQPPREILYTYQADIERVVDADTLVAKIDVGFDIFIRQRLRLRGIDAPEISTTVGRQAKKYVENTLAGCPRVVIKTYGSDKYDRYLVDVFVLPGSRDPHQVAAKGKLLNQMLLDDGLAEIWKG